FPRERIAVGVQTRGRQSDQYVARANGLPREHSLALHHAHDEPGQIVFAGSIHPRHLRGLAADQGAAVITAPARHARHNLGRDLRIQLPHREIVQKKQRYGTLHRDIVNAVVDQIFAYGGMLSGHESQLELSADPVGRRHQHRIFVTLQQIAAAEAPDVGQHRRTERAAGHRADGGDCAIRLVDIHARVFVADWFRWGSRWGHAGKLLSYARARRRPKFDLNGSVGYSE